jgi:hypothetical protein
MLRKFIILILASVLVFSLRVFVSAFIQTHKTSASNACLNNLRQIDGAKQQWALENGKTTNDIPSWEGIRPYVGRGPQGDLSGLRCPYGGTYVLGRVGDSPRCSMCGSMYVSYHRFSKWDAYYSSSKIICELSIFGLVLVIFLTKGGPAKTRTSPIAASRI